MTNSNQQTDAPSHRLVKHYAEDGHTRTGQIGAVWLRDKGDYSIVINTLDERLVFYAFTIENPVDGGPTHNLIRYYGSGRNAPRSIVGCAFTKPDGKLSVRLDRLDQPVWLTAFPIEANRTQAIAA